MPRRLEGEDGYLLAEGITTVSEIQMALSVPDVSGHNRGMAGRRLKYVQSILIELQNRDEERKQS